jgi:hypothetical protein
MYRSTVVVFALGGALAGCHPPDQAIYDHSKECYGVFDVGLSQFRPINSGEPDFITTKSTRLG